MATKEILPTYQVASNGIVLPKGFPIELYYSGLEYEAKPDDVFIVTYPGCGSVGYQYILYLLKNQGRHLPKRKRLDDFVPQLEAVGKDVVEKLDPPRVIASHLPHHLIPFNASAKYIYVARNPVDCCISFYNYTRDFPRYYGFHDGSFNTFFELFLSGKLDFGDYFDHLLSWYERRNDPNVLFLLCEDLCMDFRGNVKKIGEFLGGVFYEATHSDEIMKDVARLAGGEDCQDDSLCQSAKIDDEPKAFGKRIGDWEKYFSDEQIIRLDERILEKLGDSGASELWKKYGC